VVRGLAEAAGASNVQEIPTLQEQQVGGEASGVSTGLRCQRQGAQSRLGLLGDAGK